MKSRKDRYHRPGLPVLLAALLLAGPAPGQDWADPEPIPMDAAALPEKLEDVATPSAVPGGQPCCCCDGASSFDWSKVPVILTLPPLGNAPIVPTGPGYYSLMDVLTGTYRQKPPQYGYPRFGLWADCFFNANFKYLDNPKNTDHDYFDCLHRIHIGEKWLFSTGGSFWWRHENEVNSRLSGFNNNYDLFRVRTYGDLSYLDKFRLFVEFIDAQSLNQNLPPLVIDRNFGDFLNAFIDVKVAEIADQPVYVRGGRQELLLGSQRLISPLEWANTRRTFQGVRAFRQGEKFETHLFWVQPVIPNPTRLDSIDNNQNFAGFWNTYKPRAGTTLDAYYLFLDNTNTLNRLGLEVAPYNVSTLGTRYYRNFEQRWLVDVELMYQLGEQDGESTAAGASTCGLGYHSDRLPWDPTFWVYYDYASGTNSPDGETVNTFRQLFPFGHYYLGWLDLVARQNIHDANAHLYLFPNKWIMVWLQYHHFELASARDALYSAGGVPLRRDPTGAAGTNVGDELDLILNFHLGKHADIVVGYSKLYQGSFLAQTGPGPSPELFFLQYSYRW
ncbi:MAG: alginate export family protein [Gemmataceae bacterium]